LKFSDHAQALIIAFLVRPVHFESAARETGALQNAMQHAAVLARMASHQGIG
jgi:hypothetical protein